jgi:hypothetical protein
MTIFQVKRRDGCYEQELIQGKNQSFIEFKGPYYRSSSLPLPPFLQAGSMVCDFSTQAQAQSGR